MLKVLKLATLTALSAALAVGMAVSGAISSNAACADEVEEMPMVVTASDKSDGVMPASV